MELFNQVNLAVLLYNLSVSQGCLHCLQTYTINNPEHLICSLQKSQFVLCDEARLKITSFEKMKVGDEGMRASIQRLLTRCERGKTRQDERSVGEADAI